MKDLKLSFNTADIIWDKKGLPHSVLFDDKYFCKENGLEESKYTFCGGNALEERWQNLSTNNSGIFTIAETGFGSGLNFLCAWQLWNMCAPKNWKLHYISVDQYPFSNQDLSKALSLWPTLKNFTSQLIKQYNPKKHKILLMQFNSNNVNVTLIFDHVLKALDQIKKYSVDTWFLDGFAPSKNPEMWSEELFKHIANLSCNGTTLSTFTAAGFVRRGLSAQRFTISKAKGFGTKRHMLKGIFND
ncbi:tRNA (5-methylaminomethyl-2-thiouridylate)-methyltransferase / FAD-dependent cmnm(5)s(2)U34 oxidoreductase [hydrothermal vent metagenome]|uniref:tRNA (5-methylaminomethyl-2-thiouridylate)-methyltransferase / FAD-dependent cmnm(5)s(2)U34 oxidoreductase n=1 Tax=hydrothermal vent metagenome TaxID=652676 RepID=A0A3B1CZU0_9ZZZZ